LETVKEMNELKKKDQAENFQRGQVMQKLYKQMLIEKTIQKRQKADTLK
jgi:hypothetical protein